MEAGEDVYIVYGIALALMLTIFWKLLFGTEDSFPLWPVICFTLGLIIALIASICYQHWFITVITGVILLLIVFLVKNFNVQ